MSRKRRNVSIALGVMLVLFGLWLGSGSKWTQPFPNLKRSMGVSDENGMVQTDEFDPPNAGRGRKVVRDPAGKAKSLLKIKAGETGVFRVCPTSPGDKLALPGLDEIKSVPPGLPSLAGLASKAGLVETFEHTLRDGGNVIASVGDQDVTEYFFKDLYVRVEVVSKQGEFEDLRMEVRGKNSRIATDLTVRHGSAALFRLPESEGGWLVVFRGKDENGNDP